MFSSSILLSSKNSLTSQHDSLPMFIFGADNAEAFLCTPVPCHWCKPQLSSENTGVSSSWRCKQQAFLPVRSEKNGQRNFSLETTSYAYSIPENDTIWSGRHLLFNCDRKAMLSELYINKHFQLKARQIFLWYQQLSILFSLFYVQILLGKVVHCKLLCFVVFFEIYV